MVLFEYKVPEFIINIWSTFRIVGRLIYGGYYLILIVPIIYLLKNVQSRKILYILCLVLIIQVVDLIPSFIWAKKLANDNVNKYPYNVLYKIDFVPKNIYTDGIVNLGESKHAYIPVLYNISKWANEHNCKLSNFYFARVIQNKENKFFNALLNPNQDDIFFINFTDVSDDLKNILRKTNIKNAYINTELEILMLTNKEIPTLKSHSIPIREIFELNPNELKHKYSNIK